MERVATFALRGAGAAAGVSALTAGLVFAAFSSGGQAPEAHATPFAPIVGAATEAAPPHAEASSQVPLEASRSTAPDASTPVPETQRPEAPVTQVAAAKPLTQLLPAATPTEADGSSISDLPAYSDVQVLAMAASVRLPSGRTFQECVALGPNGKHWPVPVHLYYEGKGTWLVETHLSEVQVEFDEASASFHVKHFAPEASECLTPG